MPQRNIKLIEAARELLITQGYYMDNIWHVDDIHFICEQQNKEELSDQEAMEVFTIANEQFDGDQGMSWPQLEKALDVYLKRRSLFKDILNAPAKDPA